MRVQVSPGGSRVVPVLVGLVSFRVVGGGVSLCSVVVGSFLVLGGLVRCVQFQARGHGCGCCLFGVQAFAGCPRRLYLLSFDGVRAIAKTRHSSFRRRSVRSCFRVHRHRVKC